MQHIYINTYIKDFCLENIQRSKIKPEFTYIVQKRHINVLFQSIREDQVKTITLCLPNTEYILSLCSMRTRGL